MNNDNHLSSEERAFIMLEQQRGASLRKIASQIGRSPSTLSREINRNKTDTSSYRATRAGKAYRIRQRQTLPTLALTSNQGL